MKVDSQNISQEKGFVYQNGRIHIPQQQLRLQNRMHRQIKECTQFAVAWSPPIPHSSNDDDGCDNQAQEGRYLFSCVDDGFISCWDVLGDYDPNHENENGDDDDDDDDDDDNDFDPIKSKELHVPVIKIKASQNTLYNLQFYNLSSDWYLSVCGDDGILIYKWADIYQEITMSVHTITTTKTTTAKTMCKPRNVELEPIAHYQPPSSSQNLYYTQTQTQPQPQPPTEINCTSVDASRKVLFAAAGDLAGCYQWDLETGQLIGTLHGSGHLSKSSSSHPRGRAFGRRLQRDANTNTTQQQQQQQQSKRRHNDFLHSVCIVPGEKGYVLTGGEDGNVGMWDAKENKLIEMIHVSDMINEHTIHHHDSNNYNSSSSSSNATTDVSLSTKKRKQRNIKPNGYISGIHIEQEGGNWAAIGCGALEMNNNNGYGAGNNDGYGGGLLAMWHLPTRTITSSHTTREQIQSLTHDSNHDCIVTCGNENVVSYWSWSGERRKERVWCSPHSCFGLATNETNGMMAVCGVGDTVDCYTHVGHKSFSLTYR